MAYMNQEKKKEIAKLLKDILPKTWKYTLSVSHHSVLVMNIKSADVDLLKLYNEKNKLERTYYQLTDLGRDLEIAPKLKKLFHSVNRALHLNNFDHSDSQTDYFHVGHYVRINIGDWEKPFIHTAA